MLFQLRPRFGKWKSRWLGIEFLAAGYELLVFKGRPEGAALYFGRRFPS